MPAKKTDFARAAQRIQEVVRDGLVRIGVTDERIEEVQRHVGRGLEKLGNQIAAFGESLERRATRPAPAKKKPVRKRK